jgi:hypothetical protein
MGFSMSIGADDAIAIPPPGAVPGAGDVLGALSPEHVAAAKLRLLEAQLERMRVMIFGNSSLFFSTIRNWTFPAIGPLVLGWGGVLLAAVVPVPFIVPTGFMGAMTIGYAAGAALVWAAGLASTAAYMEVRGVAPWAPDLLLSLVVPAAIGWTAIIAGYLAWTFLRRPDEERFLAVPRDAYRLPRPVVPATAQDPAASPDPAADAVPPPEGR